MRVSAIRFGSDLWRVLESEAARVGVSVSQYVREAALIRGAAAATARGEDLFYLLAQAGPNAASAPLHDASAEVAAARTLRATSRDWIDRAEAAKDAAQAAFDAALAVSAETQQTRRHSRNTRARDHQRA